MVLIAILYNRFFYIDTYRFKEIVHLGQYYSPMNEKVIFLSVLPDGEQYYMMGEISDEVDINPLTGTVRLKEGMVDTRIVYWEKVNEKYISSEEKVISCKWMDEDNIIVNGKEINLNHIFGYDYRRNICLY